MKKRKEKKRLKTTLEGKAKEKTRGILPIVPEIDDSKKINRVNRALLSLLLVIMIVLLVATAYTLVRPQKVVVMQGEPQPYYYYPKFVSLSNSTYVSMYLPATDTNGKGILATLGVEASPGSGRILVDIEDLVFWEDTQTSIRIGKAVASRITGKNISEYDLVYTVHTNATMVGGPSAGAAIALATIAALENKSLNEKVMITGAINSDGSIGRVSSVSAKAEAAKQINVTTFLVPIGQSKEIVYEINQKCEQIGSFEYCSLEQLPKEINISTEVGIEIQEVETVEEAMIYFFD